MRPAWVEIDLGALRKNIRNLKRCTADNASMIGVIKADGYGHGAIEVANTLKNEGVNYFAVVIIEEGIQLREAGFTDPILILGHTMEEDYPELVKYQLTPAIYKYSQALRLSEAAQNLNKNINIHLKIDTGMGRLGFMPNNDTVNEIKRIVNLSNIYIEGIYTHLATADQIYNNYVKEQFRKFSELIRQLNNENIHISIKHMANSAATINFKEMHFDMVRPGTSLYGLYPGPEMKKNPTIDLYPVMSIKCKLVHIKSVPKSTPISYGCTFITQRPSIIGVVPMGYVDGVFRKLANNGSVLIRGQRCPIVGTICMDQFMVDLSDLSDVALGDEVVLIGEQGTEKITADEVGEIAGTISIEVVTRISKRMPRIYSNH